MLLIDKYKKDDGMKVDIENLEKKLELKLPEEYKIFLNKYNGGECYKSSFPVKGGSDIDYFYGIIPNAKYISHYDRIEFQKEEMIPRGVISIARNSFGDAIAIGVEDDNWGKIFFCDHDHRYRRRKVSNSLKDFIEICNSEVLDKSKLRSAKEKAEKFEKKGWEYTDGMVEEWDKQYNYFMNAEYEEVII